MNRDMYNTYSDTEFEYNYPISFNLRNKDYLEMNEMPKITWYYGDSNTIIFNIIDNDTEDMELDDATFTVTFTNFRGEEVLKRVYVENDLDPETKQLTVVINKATSKKLFKRGNYYCTVVVEEVDEEVTTLMPSRKCLISVK